MDLLSLTESELLEMTEGDLLGLEEFAFELDEDATTPSLNQILLTAGAVSAAVYEDESGSMPGINSFTTHTGAARFGKGRFLLKRVDYDALVTAAGTDGEVDLHMGDAINTLTFHLVLVGALSYSSSVGGSAASTSTIGDKVGDMVEAVLFDKRCVRLMGITKAYNVQQDGLSVDSNDSLEFYSATLSGGAAQWSWSAAWSNLSIYDGVSVPSMPAWKPRNLIFDSLPKSRTLDAVAAQLGWIVGYDYSADKYTLWLPNQLHSSNDSLLDMSLLLSGGTTQRHSARLPSSFDVTFPARDLNGADPYVNRLYSINVAVGGGNPNVKQTLHIGNYIAIRKGSSWLNAAELAVVANDLVARTFAHMNTPVGEYELIGLRNVRLDGKVRGIKWVSDRDGARTIVRYNDDRDFNPMQDFQRQTEALSNTLVIGGGSTIVGMSVGGTRLVWGGGGGTGGTVAESIGTEQYQVHQMVTANTDGWDMVMSHP